MSIFWSAEKKASEAEKARADDLRKAESALATYDRTRPRNADAETLRRWKDARRPLEEHLVDCRETYDEARETAESVRQKRAADEATRQRAETYAAGKKAAADSVKECEAINRLAAEMVERLTRLNAHRELTEEGNAARGDKPPLRDGEAILRGKPARTIPAAFETREEWVDAQGETPRQFVMRNGEMVPADGGHYQKVRRKVQVQAEKFEPEQMPTRLADLFRLYDLDGKQIWPPR